MNAETAAQQDSAEPPSAAAPAARAALNALYPKLVSGVRRRGVPAQDAEDVANEVIAAVLGAVARRAAQGEPPIRDITGFVTTSLDNEVAQYFRDLAKRRVRAQTGYVLRSDADGPDLTALADRADYDRGNGGERMLYAEACDALMGRIAGHRPARIEALKLKIVEGRSGRSLAPVLGTTPAAANQEMSQFLTKFERERARTLGDPP